MLVILIGLNGDAGQRGIAVNVIGLAQHAVAGGETVVEQVQKIDLATGGGEGIEIQIMNMNVALTVRLGKAGIQHIHLVELLGALGAELEHAAHGGIAVDVGVLALDVGIDGIFIGNVLEGFHQAGVHFAHAAALGAVENIALGGTHKALFNQHALYGILNLLNARYIRQRLVALDFSNHQLSQFPGCLAGLAGTAGHKAVFNGLLNLFTFKGHDASVTLFDGFDHDS